MFLGYVICGCQGALKANVEGPKLDDYTINVRSLDNHYYYMAPGNSHLLIIIVHSISLCIGKPRLVDMQATKDRVSDAWLYTHTLQRDFRNAIIEHDGICVVTSETVEDYEASHCLPYAKGEVHSYLDCLTHPF